MSAPALPWRAVDPLSAAAFTEVTRRAIFDCCKWDPQLEDAPALADAPVVLRAEAWRELAALAEALARETLAAEAELVERPELHRRLALPRAARAALRRSRAAPSAGVARLVRFDFHFTPDGWRISEANTDVPGGLNEASGLPALVAPHYERATPLASAGDVAGAYADALLASRGAEPRVALVHATAYSDDHQVMRYLARRLEARGARCALVSPAQLRWRDGRAWLAGDERPVDLIVRFFPAEWLPNLPRASAWACFFRGGATPQSNPGAALLAQSKRFPLVWDELRTPLPTWRALLPETRDPREARWRADDGWVLKPAMGRVGEGVGIRGVTPGTEWRKIARAARWQPAHWVAQRRFEARPMTRGDGVVYPCVGVYTVDARAVGAYGRLAYRPLTDWRSRDAAVLVEAAGAEALTRTA